ncbi:hypothetical protein M8J77_006605 [Diaphorina citri]|nr:hypothetical protein M8J77_006605 [Diaphorina citri]
MGLYPDDTTILVGGRGVGDVTGRVGRVMSAVTSWLVSNGLTLNVAKTSFAPLDRSIQNISYSSQSISSAEEVKFLGIVIDAWTALEIPH